MEKYVDLNTGVVGVVVKKYNDESGISKIDIRTDNGHIISTTKFKQFILS